MKCPKCSWVLEKTGKNAYYCKQCNLEFAIVCLDIDDSPSPLQPIKKESNENTVNIPDGNMNGYIGRLVEEIVIDHILHNHQKLIHDIYPDQSEFSTMQILKTDPDGNRQHGVGQITGKKGSWIIHGWNGDLVLILHDKEYGKRAIIFEIKYGRINLSDSQKIFFKKASMDNPDYFMRGLNDIKIFIVHCTDLDLRSKTIKMDIHEYKNRHLQNQPKAKPKPVRMKESKPMPVMKGKKKKSKKKSKNKMSIIFHKGARSRKAKRNLKRSGEI